MLEPLRLLCVFAHPDDESLGTGGILAKYAAEGVATYLITATRGERGWPGPPETNPGETALGKLREAELHAAATVLGLREVTLLDYIDGDLDQAAPAEAVRQIVAHIRRLRPQVIVTFDQNGAYGHPDHIAICQFTTAACVAAADSVYAPETGPAHQVDKLYYFVNTPESVGIYQEAFGDLVMTIDGVERRPVGWPDWAITTWIDTTTYWQQVWQAVACHKTQLPGYEELRKLPEARQRQLWGQPKFYRVFSLVNGGRAVETDLFAGLRG